MEDILDAELHFFVDKQPPLAITSYLLLEFDEIKMCQSTLASMSLDYTDCNDESRLFEFTEELPNDHSFLENNDIRIELNLKDGTISTIIQKHEDIRVELKQRFLAYDGKIQTSSGLYIFNPQHDA